MFDKVVLCKQGSSILNQVRSRTLSLESGTVKVLLLGGDKIASNWNDIEVASKETGLSVSLKEKEIPSYVISSFFSCLSELHVVARCKDTDKPPLELEQCHGVLVAVNNQAIILAVSDENIVVSDKLFMTFDVEETNNVLTAKADFDGVITQGILEERLKKIGEDFKLGTASQKDYSDNVLEEKGGGKLPTNDAIKTYVKNGALRIVKGSDGSNQTNTGLGQDAGVFTANQAGDTTFYLGLGAAADKGIVTEIPSTNASDADVPTTKAVSEFVDGVVGTGKLSLTKNGTTVEFSANEADNSSKSMSFGTAADKDYEGVITVDKQSHKASDNLPTSQAVNAFVGKGILSISKKGVNNTQDATFSANSSDNVNIILGLGDAADKGVATSFTSKNASDADVPTTSAVSNFVSGAIGTANLNITVGGNTVTTFNANQSGDVDVTLALGTAAQSTVASVVSANKPDDLPTNSAVDAFVGKGTLTVHIDGTTADVVFSANEATNSKKTIRFGNASQATTASFVSVTDATEQAKLPTNSAVDAFVGKGTLTISKRNADTTGTESFGANESKDKVIGLGLGTAADANVCTEIHPEGQQGTTTELNNAQLSSLVTLQQARQIADESTSSSKSVSPADAANDNGVMVEKGAMVWLAVNFVGDVGICDFSTVAQNNSTPVWDDFTNNKSTVAYIAKLNDNAGDFYATARKIAAGHTFRTLNAMDVSGMADPSYGFALCLCIESKK